MWEERSVPISRELAAEDTASELPTYSNQEVADYLRTGFWSWFGGRPHGFNLGSEGIAANDGTILYNLSGWYDYEKVTVCCSKYQDLKFTLRTSRPRACQLVYVLLNTTPRIGCINWDRSE